MLRGWKGRAEFFLHNFPSKFDDVFPPQNLFSYFCYLFLSHFCRIFLSCEGWTEGGEGGGRVNFSSKLNNILRLFNLFLSHNFVSYFFARFLSHFVTYFCLVKVGRKVVRGVEGSCRVLLSLLAPGQYIAAHCS